MVEKASEGFDINHHWIQKMQQGCQSNLSTFVLRQLQRQYNIVSSLSWESLIIPVWVYEYKNIITYYKYMI
ncbi:hypothetical protein A0H81_12730 [Grifola frondosa]|uniref:Uncharacterized protein n=1 Tax=Grifola frondosa TaxID=5627 RepID=A0A1C7LS65_GRIFR|nr:hypothetical protein A0H81_12730 [Grifola frondosa]